MNDTPNVDGFKEREGSGKKAALVFTEELRRMANQSKTKMVFNIDIVAHSMGYAYAQGFIEELKTGPLNNQIKWGGYYIVAPENAGSGAVTPGDWKEVWQYGTNEAAAEIYNQDGVAPQTAVGGLDDSRRAYIEGSSYATPRIKEVITTKNMLSAGGDYSRKELCDKQYYTTRLLR